MCAGWVLAPRFSLSPSCYLARRAKVKSYITELSGVIYTPHIRSTAGKAHTSSRSRRSCLPTWLRGSRHRFRKRRSPGIKFMALYSWEPPRSSHVSCHTGCIRTSTCTAAVLGVNHTFSLTCVFHSPRVIFHTLRASIQESLRL